MHLLCRRDIIRISLARFGKDEPVADGIRTHAKDMKASHKKCLTGKTSQG
jgi:hypothetical protein